ncbi:MAG: DSD1 family PLP-dependent enzyme, partial [bacterium]|nr:DSD1 family PLP-dependent enzyme [bacterium]
KKRGTPIDVFLKVDSGGGRSGVDPHGAKSIDIAAALDRSSAIDFRGILTHAGQSYECLNAAGAREVAVIERDLMVAFAARLRASGIDVGGISIGSTPTAHAFEDLTGVDEIRPGNYAFHDAFQVAIGSCSGEDVAFFVQASVIGVNPEQRRAVIDAGALALSKDPGPVHVRPDCGYGTIVDPKSQQVLVDLKLSSLSQEHGVVSAARAETIAELSVGDCVHIVPNHSCLAAACFDRYHVVRDGQVKDIWRPARGW